MDVVMIFKYGCIPSYKAFKTLYRAAKDQLISKCPFGIFKSPKKQ